jgi:hypothetical protein
MESGRVFRWEGGHFWGDDWKRCPGRIGVVVGRWVISDEKRHSKRRNEAWMPAERLPMRRIKEIIRLSWGCRQVSRSFKVARSNVGEYLKRTRTAGLSWPLPHFPNFTDSSDAFSP